MKQHVAIPFLWLCFSFVRFAFEIQQAGTLNRGLQYGTVRATEVSWSFVLPIVGSWGYRDTELHRVYSPDVRIAHEIFSNSQADPYRARPKDGKHLANCSVWNTLFPHSRCVKWPPFQPVGCDTCLPVFLPRVGCSKIAHGIWGSYKAEPTKTKKNWPSSPKTEQNMMKVVGHRWYRLCKFWNSSPPPRARAKSVEFSGNLWASYEVLWYIFSNLINFGVVCASSISGTQTASPCAMSFLGLSHM